ncbi:MAG: phosphatase PAP2 family protein [Rhodanobacter sp.]
MDPTHTPAGIRNLSSRRLSRMRLLFSTQRAWWLALATLLGLGAIGVFVDLAEDVETADHITVVDLRWANWLHTQATPALTQVMVAVSTLHDMLPMSVLTVLLAIFLRWRRHNDWFLGLMLVVPGGMVLNTFFKFVFARARPHFIDPIVTLTSYSFPSGHVAGSTLFYGFVAALLISHTSSTARRVAAVIGALLLIILVAASRMYLGAHFFSDILAAFFESVAWLGVCLVGIHLIRGRTATPARRIR